MKKAAVCIIENDRGEILLLQRNSEPYGFCFPGGKIEKDETIINGIMRELKEETGMYIKISEKDYISTIKSIITNKQDYEVYVFYVRKFAVLIKPVILSDEHSGYIWTSKPEELKLAGNTDKMLKSKKMKTDILFNRQEKLKRILNTIQ